MYEIDLLKKQGTPRKSTPILTLLTTGAIALPAFIGMLVFAEYLSNETKIRFNTSFLAKIHEKTQTVPYDVRLANKLESDLGMNMDTIVEVLSAVNRNLQWSQILNEITSLLPENLAISDIDVRRNVEKQRIKDPKDEKKQKDVETVIRTLKMTVYNLKSDMDNTDAQNYLSSLNSSPVLSEAMESAKISTIKIEDFEGQPLPCYMIECVFKSGYKGSK